MKSDLDRLMTERELDGFLVIGDSDGNPVMNYLTGGAHLEGATVVKVAGKPLTLLHGSMERDSVAASGLRLVDRDQHLQPLSVAAETRGRPACRFGGVLLRRDG